LQRAIRLGDRDRALIADLQKPRTFKQLQQHPDVATRLTALARLYLLAGPRSATRIALQAERHAPLPQDALLWPQGRQPPQHGCVGTGTCCSASFLGPVFDADARRVSALAFGRKQRMASSALFETVQFRGQEVRGMARDERGRCVAQGDDLLCEIHLAHGLAAKPVTCRQFPLRFHRSPDGVHVSLLLACDGYDRARPAALPWPERDAEIRALLAEGAAVPQVALPVTLAAGLPIAWSAWQALRTQCFAAEPDPPDPRTWLDRVLVLAEAALLQSQAELAEGPEVAWLSDLPQLRAGLYAPDALWPEPVRTQAQADLRAAAAALTGPRVREGQRLRQLADGLTHLHADLPLTDDARQHLHDVVANDLPAYVVVGELDAGLGNLTRRLLLAHGVAAALASQAGKIQIDARDTTQALHVVYRSEPELTWLGTLQQKAPPFPVAPTSGVP
jgi:Fe-S-cluster containining protein